MPVPSKPQSGFEAVVVFPLEGSLGTGNAVCAHRGSSGGTSLKMKKKDIKFTEYHFQIVSYFFHLV